MYGIIQKVVPISRLNLSKFIPVGWSPGLDPGAGPLTLAGVCITEGAGRANPPPLLPILHNTIHWMCYSSWFTGARLGIGTGHLFSNLSQNNRTLRAGPHICNGFQPSGISWVKMFNKKEEKKRTPRNESLCGEGSSERMEDFTIP